MKFPFPGMNPYLENPQIWAEIHPWLIVQLARSLNPVLKPTYRAAVEQRVYTDFILVGIPDVSVFQRSEEKPKPLTSNSSGTQTLHKPLKVTIPMPEEIKENYLEIRQVGSDRVITVIEVLSPKNKRVGEGLDQYNAKRRKVLESQSHLVEIDLLRSGNPLPISGGISSDYRILLSRAYSRPEAELYAFDLQEPVPLFPLPLQIGDQEPIVNLHQELQEIYESASLDLVMDYAKPPVSRLVQLN
jgi:Protein of unknown function (DUF4058)